MNSPDRVLVSEMSSFAVPFPLSNRKNNPKKIRPVAPEGLKSLLGGDLLWAHPEVVVQFRPSKVRKIITR
jgi:hypothetical protein